MLALKDLERNVTAASSLCNDYQMWALVRLVLYQNKDTQHSSNSSILDNIFYNLHLVTINTLELLGKMLCLFNELNSGSYRKKYIQSLGLKDGCIFISRKDDYSNSLAGKQINKNIDPYIRILSRKHKTVKVHLGAGDDKINKYYPSIRIDLSIVDGLATLVFKVQNVFSAFLYKDVKKSVQGLWFDRIKYRTYLRSVKYFSTTFERIFSYSKPKVIFMTCFYSPVNMGIIDACKKSGVLVVDIAHGKIGDNHPMYTGWGGLLNGATQLLPDYVWVWGYEISKIMDISNTTSENKQLLKSIVGGNMWLTYWNSLDRNDKYNFLTKEQYSFLSSLNKYNKVILFSGQNKDIPENILKAIHLSPSNWFWLIRSHPIHKLDKNSKSFKTLESRQYSNYDILHSSSLNLYLLLENATHHITAWSSVCYESLNFNLPTIIAHETGYDLYHNYISNGVFNYAIPGEDLVDIIKNNKHTIKEDTPYIEVDLEKAESSFENVLCAYENMSEL